MHVKCLNCGEAITVPSRPSGRTGLSGVEISGNVDVRGGGIAFGPGGRIGFGPSGKMSLGGPPPLELECNACGHKAMYNATEICE